MVAIDTQKTKVRKSQTNARPHPVPLPRGEGGRCDATHNSRDLVAASVFRHQLMRANDDTVFLSTCKNVKRICRSGFFVLLVLAAARVSAASSGDVEQRYAALIENKAGLTDAE